MGGEREFALALTERPSEEAWQHTGEGEWQARSLDATKGAVIRHVAGEYEARVWQHPTGPDGPDPKLAHGPEVFATAGAALDYCESRMGWAAAKEGDQ
jgi:hypothetical protein